MQHAGATRGQLVQYAGRGCLMLTRMQYTGPVFNCFRPFAAFAFAAKEPLERYLQKSSLISSLHDVGNSNIVRFKLEIGFFYKLDFRRTRAHTFALTYAHVRSQARKRDASTGARSLRRSEVVRRPSGEHGGVPQPKSREIGSFLAEKRIHAKTFRRKLRPVGL